MEWSGTWEALCIHFIWEAQIIIDNNNFFPSGCWNRNPELWVGKTKLFCLFGPNSIQRTPLRDNPNLRKCVYFGPNVWMYTCCYTCASKLSWTTLSSTLALGDWTSKSKIMDTCSRFHVHYAHKSYKSKVYIGLILLIWLFSQKFKAHFLSQGSGNFYNWSHMLFISCWISEFKLI